MFIIMAKRRTSKPAAGRVVRLFKNGRNQAVRIPREWELPGKTALVTKGGARLILEPIAKKNFIEVLRALGPLPPEDWFPDIDDDLPPVKPVEL
jgi:antitoxin VapB